MFAERCRDVARFVALEMTWTTMCSLSELLHGLHCNCPDASWLLYQPLCGHLPVLREMFPDNCPDTARLLPGECPDV
jgi:hypothetical protein